MDNRRGRGGCLFAVVIGLITGLCTGATAALCMAWFYFRPQPDLFDVIGVINTIQYGSVALGGIGAFVGAWLALRTDGAEDTVRLAAMIAVAFLGLAYALSTALLISAG